MANPATNKQSEKARTRDYNPYLKQVVRSFRPTFIAVFTFSFFINLLTLTVPLFLLQIYSKVIPSKNIDTLLYLSAIALVAILFLGLLEAVRRSLLVKAGTRFEYQLSEHLLNSAIHRSLIKSYASVNVLRELARVRSFISGSNIIPLLDVPWTPLFLLMLFALHPYIGAVGVVGALLMIAFALLNERSTRALTENANDSSKNTIEEARAYVKNAHAVQAMGMQKNILPRWKQSNTASLGDGLDATGLNTRIASISKVFRLCLQIVIICVAAWLIVTDELTAGATIASVLLLRRAISPLEGAIRSWRSVVGAQQAFGNISEYLNHASTFDEAKQMPEPEGQLKGTNLSFKPAGHKKSIFSKVNIALDPGTITALIGSTAAGKSTLLKILCGVIKPSSGQVTLGGYELKQWDAEALGAHVGYLPQDVALFPGTVRENIGRMADAPIEDVIEASLVADSHNMIQQLPDGYETVITEDGQNLSGGQKQRIGLARALYNKPIVVLLDEPDANLDAEGRSTLRKCLRKIKEHNIAVVVISHRRSLTRVADRIYELADGRLREIDKRKTKSEDKPEKTETNGSRVASKKGNVNALSILKNASESDNTTHELTPEERVSIALQKLSLIRQKSEEEQ